MGKRGELKVTSNELRRQFIDYFRSLGHQFVPSWPVIPFDDPTLLFTNAGMNQFKPIFLNQEKPRFKRAVNSQKCIRVSGKHNDLEEVGKDTYHHTFFEMLGNWSFGDYYKAEAIEWAWKLLTEVWGLDKARLWATVYRDDDEAAELWRKVTDIDPERILRFGEKDNFWEMGETGPCGPCSEIHYYLGKDLGQQTPAGVNHLPEYIELWNLVFIQFNRLEDGTLEPLPSKHVDTGAGFERLLAVLQGVDSNYDTDLFIPLIQGVEELTGVKYDSSSKGMPHRVIADHVRMLSFSIADGALPSNEGRGYVLRRILRRASRFGHLLQMKEPFIYKLVPLVGEIMGTAFPEVVERMEHIQRVIRSEEDNFLNTLDRGIEVFYKLIRRLKSSGEKIIPGKEVFKLYDTYGFPPDLTRLMAEEEGFVLEMESFNQELERQRERARKKTRFKLKTAAGEEEWELLSEGEDSIFVGYEYDRVDTVIRRYRISEGQVYLILAETPFYAEAGGQIGDTGEIRGDGFKIRVLDTQRSTDGSIVHIGSFVEGDKITTSDIIAGIDLERRRAIMRNHTSTHLLHAALRKTLGNHVQQSGSLVADDHLRFDFSHYEKLSAGQIEEIEKEVNRNILKNLPVHVSYKKFDEARQEGAIALFGEKYGETVRVISIPGVSMELCGGTHVRRTGDIGGFKIVAESAVAAGIRRIEAISGMEILNYIYSQERTLQEIQQLLKTGREALLTRLESLLKENKSLHKQIEQLQSSSAGDVVQELVSAARNIKGISVAAGRIEATSMEQLKSLADHLRDRLKSGIGILFSVIEDKPMAVGVVTRDLIDSRGIRAGDLMKEVGKELGGGGGGLPHMATAGGKEKNRIDVVLQKLPEILKKVI